MRLDQKIAVVVFCVSLGLVGAAPDPQLRSYGLVGVIASLMYLGLTSSSSKQKEK